MSIFINDIVHASYGLNDTGKWVVIADNQFQSFNSKEEAENINSMLTETDEFWRNEVVAPDEDCSKDDFTSVKLPLSAFDECDLQKYLIERQQLVKPFAVHNDTDKWVVIVDGYFQYTENKEDANNLYDELIGDSIESSLFGTSDLLPPFYQVSYIDGTKPEDTCKRSCNISDYKPIDLRAYKKELKANLQERLKLSKAKKEWWESLSEEEKLEKGFIKLVENPNYDPNYKASDTGEFDVYDFFNIGSGVSAKDDKYAIYYNEATIKKGFLEYYN